MVEVTPEQPVTPDIPIPPENAKQSLTLLNRLACRTRDPVAQAVALGCVTLAYAILEVKDAVKSYASTFHAIERSIR
jgi:hypothetical protein